MHARFAAGLSALCEAHQAVRSLHPALETLQPVAIVEGAQFLVYEAGLQGRYALALETPVPMPVPAGVRAAFPLEAYGNRPVCVVTGEVFDEPHGLVTLLHEFIHCYQANTCELPLKQGLSIARQAVERGDYLWELNYPFPYADSLFVECYSALFRAQALDDFPAIQAVRQQLHAGIAPDALEYLHWQEWKEGLARYLENCMCRQLGLPENHYGNQQPYDRISFYEGGAAWIAALAHRDAGLLNDIEALFHRMAQPSI
ncbi:MAG: hypothetical protein ACOYYS_11600 [Chloroflexota bacterium]